MVSVSFLAILISGAFLFLLILLFKFFVFRKISVTYDEFKSSNVVYRIVKGDLQALEKEQHIFTRRAQSLWGKEMRSWSTFRITFPNIPHKYAIFGIIVPDSFNCDKECLEELGFKFGSLDSLPYAAKIEMPTRFCYSLKLNQHRALKTFKLLFRNKFRRNSNDINKKSDDNNNGNSLEPKKNNDSFKNLETSNEKYSEQNNNIHHSDSNESDNKIVNNTNEQNDLIDNNNNFNIEIEATDNNNHIEISNNDDKLNNHNVDDNQISLSNESNNNSDIQDNDNSSNKNKNDSDESNDKSENKLNTQSKKELNENQVDFEAKIEFLTEVLAFAEIRNKTKKKQIFIIPLMNYDELTGLWIPDD